MSKRKGKIRNRLLAGLLILAILAFVVLPLLNKRETGKVQTVENTVPGTGFRKDGELVFIGNDGRQKNRVEIEIAETEESRTRGLMYRTDLDQSEGMLFIFKEESERYFWMKNTPLPLDIFFISADSTIVHTAKNTQPYSEATVFSVKPAKYVLEVNAGYAEKNRISIGDKVRFSK